MTGQAFYYMGETELKHKVLAIAEEQGASKAAYALKLLQSEGVLSIASTGKDPRHPWAHVYLGVHVEREGQAVEAMEEYRIASGLAPEMAISVFFMGTVNESLGNLELAREQIQQAAELEPFDPRFAEYLAKFDKRHRGRKSRKRLPG